MKYRSRGGADRLTGFLQGKAISPLVSSELLALIENPIRFRHSGGGGEIPCSQGRHEGRGQVRQYLGERCVRLTINSLVGVVLALVMVGSPPFSWQGILAPIGPP